MVVEKGEMVMQLPPGRHILGVLSLLVLALTWPVHASASRFFGNPIQRENQLPGSTGWRVVNLADGTPEQIVGYASQTSVAAGNTITFRVSVNPPASNPSRKYSLAIYRMGWYGGQGGRLVHQQSDLDGITQPDCALQPETGLIECDWSDSYRISIPHSWTTGIYMTMLTSAAGYQWRIPFVVRQDYGAADFLYVQPVFTYNAYAAYPASVGKSLYASNSRGALTLCCGTLHAVKVSLDRPVRDQFGDSENTEFGWEVNLVRWLERMGYNLSYTTDLALHLGISEPLFYNGMLSAGHQEYWTKEMYQRVERARDRGVHLAFFGANAVYWQVRLEPSSKGVPHRVIVGYKEAALEHDPITDPTRLTTLWRNLGRAEQALVGVQFTSYNRITLPQQPFVVKNSQHWVYRGTGFQDGSVVEGIVGYEIDRGFAEYPLPASRSNTYTVLGESPFTTIDGLQDVSQSSIYQARSGAWVFATGTMSWSWALDRPGFVNPGIQRTTQNLLQRFLDGWWR